MKIGVILATRGRPRQALGVIEAMRLMASGRHKVEFTIACDRDDPDTERFFNRTILDENIIAMPEPRPTGVGQCWNRVAAWWDADLLLTMTDDALIATPNWDQITVDTFASHPWAHPELAIACLNDTANPGQATLFAFRPSWFRHCGLFDTRFPAWFSDTAIAETYSFITGEMIPMLGVTAVLKPGVYNPRLRNMKLWWRLYACTRVERLQRAKNVRDALRLPEPENLWDLTSEWLKRDLRGLPESEEIVRRMNIQTPPDDCYMQAERAAITYVQEHAYAAAHIDA